MTTAFQQEEFKQYLKRAMAKLGFQTGVSHWLTYQNKPQNCENPLKNKIEHATITFLWQNRVENISREKCKVMDSKKLQVKAKL